ncbi:MULTISPECIES: hypothetical protein [unclassified Pseudomonas]|jgi:hypothetical protein|uniref:hypothetical protein n=2 Tax=Pseudomonas TaxID=286 RepID=UPI000839675A|nr:MULTISPECIES: hypothetical protein [unclassified Pseudomonas]QIH07353.1 hypothetical protein ATY02_11785 [Pseudomonas sp. BIOMIG1BAC]HBP4949343.1 hypothetical protein [Pseudomonas aeruginosa]
MGSTVSTGKLVAAFKTNSGKTMYVLFEETYESNCYPRTPRWGCLMMGETANIMSGIFHSAGSCEGGMLKGAGGRDISPEGYIQGWLKELANPVMLNDQTFELAVGDSLYSTVPKSEFDMTKERLTVNGFEAEAIQLENGEKLTVSLYEHGELLASIYDGNVGAWRIIEGYNAPIYGLRNPELGYAPAKAKTFEIETHECMRLFKHREDVAVKDQNGDWRNRGWAYSIIGNYVRELWQAELREPGSYRARIKNLRNAIETAPIMPTDAVVVIDTTVKLESWTQEGVTRLVNENPHTIVGHEIHVAVPQDPDQAYRVCCLHEDCTKFVCIPLAAEEPAPAAPTLQLDLLAS